MTVADLFATAAYWEYPVACWRRPGASTPEAVISLQLELLAGQPPTLESGPAGFAFFPFVDSDRSPALWLPADGYHDGHALHGAEPATLEGWQLLFEAMVPATPPHPPHPPQPPQPLPFCADETAYRALVSAGVAALAAGVARKVVPSRAAVRRLPLDFDTWTAFERLCAAYPQAFVSLVSVPSHGRWLGASPELLAEVADGRTFRTVALAGTQAAPPEAPPEAARWSQKELEEQAHVTRYVIDCFKHLRLREYEEVGPRTVRAGHLWHLRTDYSVDLTQVPFPTLGTDMLRLLHPTSAVAGMPRAAALAWLREHEGYNRSYYSGFLGPVNLPTTGTSAVYVNLRCMQLREDEAILYAGAGLTPESDPAHEWAETEEKLRIVAEVVL